MGILFLVLAVASVGLYIYDKNRITLITVFNDFRLKPSSRLSTQEQFALACGGHLTVMNGAYLNSLTTGLDKPQLLKLIGWWEFGDRASAIETIEIILQTGHREYFDLITMVMETYPAGQWNRQLATIQATHHIRRDLVVYKDNLIVGINYLRDNKLQMDNPVTTVAAWDFGRLINVCRWSCALNFISEKEAWAYIMQAARQTQQAYASWEEMSLGYLLGRYMWGGNEVSAERTIQIHKILLTNEKSPWRLIPWNTPLTRP